MRIAVCSDIHANLEALEAVLEDIQSIECAKLYCCGDVVGYGSSPNECCELLREHGVVTVRGNHDEAASIEGPLPADFNPIAAESIGWTRRQLTRENRAWLRSLPLLRLDRTLGITLCHAAPANPADWSYIPLPALARPSFACLETPVAFMGHSHAGAMFWIEGDGHIMMVPPCVVRIRPKERYLINVGSVGQPRDEDPRASYFVYDLADGVLGPRRVAYDLELAQRKIRAAGLPEKLAGRLELGR